MRVRKNVLNNMIMNNHRKNPVYQTLITDLAILGVIRREDAENLLGYKIPAFLQTPDGQYLEPDEGYDKPPVKESSPADEADETDEADEKEPTVTKATGAKSASGKATGNKQ